MIISVYHFLGRFVVSFFFILLFMSLARKMPLCTLSFKLVIEVRSILVVPSSNVNGTTDEKYFIMHELILSDS